MPELPDVELFRRRLSATSLRRRVVSVRGGDRRLVAPLAPKTFAGRLNGRRFVSARRHGKYLFVRLDKGGWLALHFGMTGDLRYVRRGVAPPAFARLLFEFADGSRLVFADKRRLGRLRIVADTDAFIAAQGLGPDALSGKADLRVFKAALKTRKCGVKSALMDQGAIAGVGNIYSDEILFQAGIKPKRSARTLKDKEIARVFRQMKRVLRTAIARHAGSEQLLERLPPSFLLRHRVKGGKCPRCRRPFRTLKLAGRTGYYCGHCQS